MLYTFNSFFDNKYSFSNEKVDNLSYEMMKEIAEEINKYVEEKKEEKEITERSEKNKKDKK